ncbi:MAG TPA: VOC family protein [Chitinophagaceae bacterium]|nr:VOC family protein [Chitinophagaceae bacterium]
MTIKDSSITIYVTDMDKAILFYQSLGLLLKNRWGDHYAELTAPGLVIGLHPTKNGEPAPGAGNISIGFTTDEFEEVSSFLKDLHIKVTPREEEGGQFLHFNDPDGTALFFIKPKLHYDK